MAVATVALIAAAPVVLGAATATAGGATATVGVAIVATTTITAEATSVSVSVGLSVGPVGWMIIGCSQGSNEIQLNTTVPTYTLDCWKPVLHDESMEPSNGMLIKDLLADSRIKNVAVENNNSLPNITLENIWDEKFRIEYLELSTVDGGMMVAGHAARI